MSKAAYKMKMNESIKYRRPSWSHAVCSDETKADNFDRIFRKGKYAHIPKDADPWDPKWDLVEAIHVDVGDPAAVAAHMDALLADLNRGDE